MTIRTVLVVALAGLCLASLGWSAGRFRGADEDGQTLMASAEAAAPADLQALQGRYAFNWRSNPAKQKCFKIEKKHVDEWAARYTCDLTEFSNTASGKPAVKCTQKSGSVEYLIFKSSAFCNEERETQAANGE